MNNDLIPIENIELSLPLNAAYVSTVRLTASSIANRVGFEVDAIEDIKSAVSETCTYIMKKASLSKTKIFKVVFIIEGNNLTIKISSDLKIDKADLNEEMCFIMVKALMDSVEVVELENGLFEMDIIKKKTENTI